MGDKNCQCKPIVVEAGDAQWDETDTRECPIHSLRAEFGCWRIELGWVGENQEPFLVRDGHDGIRLDIEAAKMIRDMWALVLRYADFSDKT